MLLGELLAGCSKLPRISSEAVEAYAVTTDRLINHVTEQLESHPNIRKLIGRNPLKLLHNNHRNHAAFISAVLKTNSHELLTRTIPWFYRSYHAKGISYDYFPVELVAWQIAIRECLDSSISNVDILAVYTWIVQHHEQMIQLSLSVATVFNLNGARKIIEIIKKDQKTRDSKVIVGGYAFNGMPQLWETMGADGYAAEAGSAVLMLNDWGGQWDTHKYISSAYGSSMNAWI